MNEMEEIMNSGKLYDVRKITSQDVHYHEYLRKMEAYNSLGYTMEGEEKKRSMLKELFAEVGENSYVQAPYYAMWGGHHVHLGKNVWIASNVTILPGVHIGDNSVIGACSVVTKDIPANVIAFGNPLKIHRTITTDDDICYDRGKLISENIAALSSENTTNDNSIE